MGGSGLLSIERRSSQIAHLSSLHQPGDFIHSVGMSWCQKQSEGREFFAEGPEDFEESAFFSFSGTATDPKQVIWVRLEDGLDDLQHLCLFGKLGELIVVFEITQLMDPR